MRIGKRPPAPEIGRPSRGRFRPSGSWAFTAAAFPQSPIPAIAPAWRCGLLCDPNLRVVSPHSTWVACRAPEHRAHHGAGVGPSGPPPRAPTAPGFPPPLLIFWVLAGACQRHAPKARRGRVFIAKFPFLLLASVRRESPQIPQVQGGVLTQLSLERIGFAGVEVASSAQ